MNCGIHGIPSTMLNVIWPTSNDTQEERMEIIGIPDSYGDNLEFNVIRLLKIIGLPNLSSYDIIACHRLQKIKKDKPANVIVRFVNLKDAHVSLINRNMLKLRIPEIPNLFIVENLCPEFRAIFDASSNLKNEGKLKFVWSYNGIVHFKKTVNYRERGIKVFHMSKLDDHFPNIKEILCYVVAILFSIYARTSLSIILILNHQFLIIYIIYISLN